MKKLLLLLFALSYSLFAFNQDDENNITIENLVNKHWRIESSEVYIETDSDKVSKWFKMIFEVYSVNERNIEHKNNLKKYTEYFEDGSYAVMECIAGEYEQIETGKYSLKDGLLCLDDEKKSCLEIQSYDGNSIIGLLFYPNEAGTLEEALKLAEPQFGNDYKIFKTGKILKIVQID